MRLLRFRNGPVNTFVAVALVDDIPGNDMLDDIGPITVILPAVVDIIPELLVPAVTLPDTLIIPVDALLIPYPLTAVTLPVTITVPVELLSIPRPPAPDVTLPEIMTVPVDKFPITATGCTDEPMILPVIVIIEAALVSIV